MRLLFIICDAGVDGRVMRMLENVPTLGYTRFTGAIGHGNSGPREGTPIWPGLNSILLVGVPEEVVPEVIAGLERLRNERQGRLALKVYSVPAEEYF